MALWTALTLAAFGFLGLGLALAVRLGSARQDRATARAVETLVRGAPRQAAGTVTFEGFDRLPAPVRRYLRLTLKEGQPHIRAARIRQRGELRTGVRGGRWLRFRADHVLTPLPPGFVWDARVAMAPLVHVRVRDAYLAGRGSTEVMLLSAVTAAATSGRFEMDSGALHRFLAEAVWCPTALLPSARLAWSPIDDDRALAALTDSGNTVSLEFRFNETGEVTGIYSPGRWGSFDDGFRQVPWEGHFRRYEERDGMRVPTEGEVGWHLSGRWEPVWKGRMLDVRYDFVPEP
jgi:hypothetical protein